MRQQRGHSSRRGFAAMSPAQRHRIAVMGGHASHGGGRSHEPSRSTGRRHPNSRRGFAAMDPEEHRRISAMGGRASHHGAGYYTDDDRFHSEPGHRRRRTSRANGGYRTHGRSGGKSRRGFAAMDPELQRRIASMGGRASHGGRGRQWEDEDESLFARGQQEFNRGQRFEDEDYDQDYQQEQERHDEPYYDDEY